MKQYKYTKFFGWLAAAVVLLTASCTEDIFTNSKGLSDEVTVSFVVAPEAATVATRAGEEGDSNNSSSVKGHISDGSHIDVLVYALYDQNGKRLDDFGATDTVGNKKPGIGQVVQPMENGHTQVELTLKRGEVYTIAFWAQNSTTTAYNTLDLRKVEVDYSKFSGGERRESDGDNTALNNDELRDAFCRKLTFTAGETGLNQNVYLYRPLAQINIGTTGYDYEIVNRHAQKKYTYSKIRLNRVARYFDVVEDKTYSSTTDGGNSFGTGDDEKTPESFAVADFGYAKIPAYVNMAVPQYPSHTKYDWEYGGTDYTFTGDDGTTVTGDEGKLKTYKDEEFLRVHLGKENVGDKVPAKDSLGYIGYANLNDHNNEETETFKYLSMCYVLTSSTKDEAITINNVQAWLATEDGDSVQILDINNVPAQRNWRTNIIGNILTEENEFTVTLDKDFAGEYSGMAGENDEWEKLSGPIAEGVYYDAKSDEIQISNANGLLWFQRMVNGDIFVRDEKGYKAQFDAKSNLFYYDENGREHEFIYKGYKYSDYDKQTRDRIIAATHVEYDKAQKTPSNYDWNNHWPNWNNFNFYGATIKLMADIDLTGIEWIPIGLDISLHDTSLARPTPNGNTDVTIDYLNAEYIHGKRRIFCGTFDGNGHTIKNLKTFRVGAKVHDKSLQTVYRGPYDNFQWYPYGLFGMVVDHAKIKNVRLQNVDIKGYDACGALVGIVFSGDNQSGDMVIDSCYVDGGTVSISPMYRGDNFNGKDYKDRTFARGVFCGGLVGDIVIAEPDKNRKLDENPPFTLTNCDVRNLTLRAYRQVGGLVGGIGNYENYKEGSSSNNAWDWDLQLFNLNIKDNTISNVLIICNQFQAFNTLFNAWEGDKNNDKTAYIGNTITWRNGFGWSATYRSLGAPVVGGIYEKDAEASALLAKYNSDNPHSNVTVAEFETSREALTTTRLANIGSVPLYEMPMLSSWFCDEITLNANYYGQPSAYVKLNCTKDFAPRSNDAPEEKFSIPFKLPYDLAPDYVTTSPRAGLYVESVTLDGKGGIGRRSVITPTDVTGVNNCAMYVTARDRTQFLEKIILKDAKGNARTEADPIGTDCQNYGLPKPSIPQPTIIKNMVLRGEPYAYTGMLLAPNENMSSIELDNVAIYDVYQTLALYNSGGTKNEENSYTQWPYYVSAEGITLSVKNCNFRGYTVPGVGWKEITYTGTTFEEGTHTGRGNDDDAKTYKVEAPTTFTNCYFKAPYIIEIASGVEVNFGNGNNACYATSTSTGNVPIESKSGCTKIEIETDALGRPTVTYYDANGAIMR